METQSHMAFLNASFFVPNHIKTSKSQESHVGLLRKALVIIMDYSFESSTCGKDDQKVEVVEEPEDLLEKSWFFGNLLHRKTRMSRCYSDPNPTSSVKITEDMLVGKSYEETYSSIKKLPPGDNLLNCSGLKRTPSLPEDSTNQRASKGRNNHLHRGNSILETPPRINNLIRAPSLPSSLGRNQEIHDEESDFSMSRLIRQASLRRADVLPPRHVPKGVSQSSSIEAHRQRRKQDTESIPKEFTSAPERRKQQEQKPISRGRLAKSSSDAVFQELKSSRYLSIKFDETDQLDRNEGKTFSHLSKQRSIPSSTLVPDWADNRSSEDMKAQIKFWARAVASNVRQEY